MKTDPGRNKSLDAALIAPCGINCGTCLAYLRDKNLRWRCTACGGTICVHRGHCLNCSK